MDREGLVDWLDRYWLPVVLGIDLLLFLLAVLLWKPGSKPIAMGIGVFALIIPLSIVAVAIDGVDPQAEEDERRPGRRE